MVESTFQMLRGGAAEEYERVWVPRLFTPFAMELVDLLALRPGERVLDVACGTGALTRIAAARIGSRGKVVGVDVNAEMLTVARAVAGGPAIEWHEANAATLPLPGQAFDVVTCQQGLQFMADRPAALREMRRVLVPGGRLGVACWRSTTQNPGFLAQEQALMSIVGPGAGRLPQFVLDDLEELRRLVLDAGFQDVVMRISVHSVRFASPEDFVQIAAANQAARFGWSDAQRAAFMAAAADGLRLYADDFGVTFPMSSHVVTARV